jgi:hypothetical protein
LPSVFGARRRLATSATATTYGHSARSSHNPRRDGHRDALPFLYLPRPLPCGSGDRRRAAQRPPIQTPVPVLPGSPGLPDRDTCFSAPPPRIAPRSASGDQRARVRGPSEGRVDCRAVRATFLCSRVRCMRFEECMRTSFPSSAPSGHPLSPVRSPRGEETRSRRRTEPRSTFRRRPAKVNAIPQTGMPSTVAPASGVHPSDCSAE